MTAEEKLTTHIATFERGTIFFPEQLECLGISPDMLRFLLSDLSRQGHLIVRLARGIYCYPEVDQYGMARRLPSPDEVARAVAARYMVHIVPCASQAAYLCGLSPYTSSPYRYATDGSDQVVNLQNGQKILFVKRLSHKVYHYRSERMRNLVEGLRFLGAEKIGSRERGVIADNLMDVTDADFVSDVKLAPKWVRDLLMEIRLCDPRALLSPSKEIQPIASGGQDAG